jgi:hypothetical protein
MKPACTGLDATNALHLVTLLRELAAGASRLVRRRFPHAACAAASALINLIPTSNFSSFSNYSFSF